MWPLYKCTEERREKNDSKEKLAPRSVKMYNHKKGEPVAIPHQYDLSTTIEPEKGKIAVSAKVLLTLPRPGHLSFDIHESFVIENFLINGRTVLYTLEPNVPQPLQPASKKVTTNALEDSNHVVMSIEYHGHLTELPEWGTYENQKLALDDQINSKMVELASYSCWYPVFEPGSTFSTTLEVSLPPTWKCVCSGRKRKESKTEKRVTTYWVSKNDWDIIIVASPEFVHESVNPSGTDIHLYYTRLPHHYVTREVQNAQKTLELFTTLLGEPVSGASFTHVYSPKKKGQGGFARPGMIVTSEGRIIDALAENPTMSFLRGIAHEIAHFWWSFGSGQGDWINETFAEYFSLIAVREINSTEEFKKYVKTYREYVRKLPDSAPSLSEVPFSNDDTGYVIRYYKGSIMLDDFRNVLGDKKFFEICREFYHTFHKRDIRTPEFCTFWSEKLGDYSDVLQEWITAKGGLPVK